MSDHRWFQVVPKGHHGFPQPECTWADQTYKSRCASCGIFESQVSPFRFRTSRRASHSHFRQLNWVFDAWFISPEIEESMREHAISGVDFGPALDHKTGQPLTNLRQLIVTGVIDHVETSKLPPVTCKPFNEEAGTYRTPPAGPFCGKVKHHPPTSLVIPQQAMSGATDLSLTTAWFGSGYGAFRLTIASRRFSDLVASQRWRGLGFEPVLHTGQSSRAV